MLLHRRLAAGLSTAMIYAVPDAQTDVIGLYTGFGVAVAGAEFTADGIVHVPMRREGSARAR